MAWTTPKTWSSEPLTSGDLNQYIRDNQNYLKGRVESDASQYVRASGSYTTTSTSSVDVDSTNMDLTITTTGFDVLVLFRGFGRVSIGNARMTLLVEVDSATEYTMVRDYRASGTSNEYRNLCFSHIFSGLSAGSHTFTLRWFVSTGTGTLDSGALLFDAREITGDIA